MYAQQTGVSDSDLCIDELIASGADVNIKDRMGWTALIYAIFNGRLDFAKKLIKAGADVNLVDNNGCTALINVVTHSHIKPNGRRLANQQPVKCARELITAGAEVNAKDKNGNTALYHALCNSDWSMAALLLKSGADTDKCEKLLVAAMKSCPLVRARKLFEAYVNRHTLITSDSVSKPYLMTGFDTER